MSQIIIADDQPLLRSGLRHLLEAAGHRVLAELDDGPDTLQRALQLSPDLLILSLGLPRLGGLEVIQRLRLRGSRARILVLTSHTTDHYVALCLQAGATGFAGKQEPLAQIAEAVATVLGGHSRFPAERGGVFASPAERRNEEEQLRGLSPRELTVLRYLANGRSNKDIANELALSAQTVSTYKTRLLEKLNTDSLAGLLEIAWRNGLLQHMPGESAAAMADGGVDTDIFRGMFDALPVPVSLRDTEGRLLAANPSYLAFFNLERDRAIGTRIGSSADLDPDEGRQMIEVYLEAVAQEQAFSRDFTLHYGDRLMLLRYWGVPYRDAENRMLGMIGSVVDISAHHQEVMELSEAKTRLESLKKGRALFLQGAGEGFRATLKAILNMLDDGEQMPVAEREQVRQSAQRMAERLELLLDVVQLENQQLLLMPEPAALQWLTEDEGRWHMERNPTLQLTFAPGPRAAEAEVWIDTRRYRQMLQDLFAFALEQGARQLTLSSAATWLSYGELGWRLTLSADRPLPRAPRLAPSSMGPVLASPHLSRCHRLAKLMNGELLQGGQQDREVASLHIRLPLAAGR